MQGRSKTLRLCSLRAARSCTAFSCPKRCSILYVEARDVEIVGRRVHLLLGAADAELIARNGDGVEPDHLHSYGGPGLCDIPSALPHGPHL